MDDLNNLSEMNFTQIKIAIKKRLRKHRLKAAYIYLKSVDFNAKIYNSTLWVEVVNLNGDLVWMELSSPQVKAFADNYFFED